MLLLPEDILFTYGRGARNRICDRNNVIILFYFYFRRNAASGVWLIFLLPCAIITGFYTCKADSEAYVISTIVSCGLLVSAVSNVLHCDRFPAKPLSYIVTAAVVAQLLTLYTDLGKSILLNHNNTLYA